MANKELVENVDVAVINNGSTTVLVDNYLIRFFKSKSVDIRNKNDKLINLLSNTIINAKDSDLGRFKTHLYMSEEKKKELKGKQVELGYTNFTQFVNAVLYDFYEKQHIIREKPVILNKTSKKSKINLAKFQRLTRKCKKKLMEGKHTSYDENVERCHLSASELKQKLAEHRKLIDDIYNIRNCYAELETAVQWNVTCDCLEAYILAYTRKYVSGINSRGFITTYNELIGLNGNNFEEREAEYIEEHHIPDQTMMTIDGEKEITPEIYDKIDDYIIKKYDFEIPDITTYFYLWIYYIYHENKVYSGAYLTFNTDDEYAEKLLEKYTFDNILSYYSKSDQHILVEGIFDDETIKYLDNNKLISY